MMTERKAEESDAEWLWRIYRDLLKEYIAIQWGWDQSFQEKYFTESLPISKFVIVSNQGVDVAAYLANEESDHIYLKMILVRKEYRGKGIGVSILEKLKERSRSAGRPLKLSVFDANPVSEFYTKNGFKIIGRKESGYIFEYAP